MNRSKPVIFGLPTQFKPKPMLNLNHNDLFPNPTQNLPTHPHTHSTLCQSITPLIQSLSRHLQWIFTSLWSKLKASSIVYFKFEGSAKYWAYYVLMSNGPRCPNILQSPTSTNKSKPVLFGWPTQFKPKPMLNHIDLFPNPTRNLPTLSHIHFTLCPIHYPSNLVTFK